MERHDMSLIVDKSDLPVLKPFRLRGAAYDEMYFVRWLASIPLIWVVAIAIALPGLALAQSGSVNPNAYEALWRWMPFLLTNGFLFNVVISLLAMSIGTALGVLLGLAQISRSKIIRRVAWFLTQLFRNSPWLVLLFIVLLAVPFQIELFGQTIRIPAWMKAVLGLSLPVMANISEIVRGAVLSVPSGQWEASESLGFTRRQTLYEIVLPQCVKRMIPPWMNWYAILTMATPLCSLLGVEEIITLSRQAMSAENNQPELLVPFYGFALVCFFLYCYPIARFTIWLERRVSVKL
ncbi:MAG: amino acid ABC transporter permease [Pseudomonadota bacterium]